MTNTKTQILHYILPEVVIELRPFIGSITALQSETLWGFNRANAGFERRSWTFLAYHTFQISF